LKPELARGEITVIGATTQEEYRKIIEPEQAFNRRFEVLTVNEPDEKTCKMIDVLLKAIKNTTALKWKKQRFRNVYVWQKDMQKVKNYRMLPSIY
jgi:ATP-dependent Clp protease ATP-binding subunit ClpA